MTTSADRFIALPQDPVPPSAFGGKGAALARLGSLGFDIPPWFAVLPGAFEAAFDDASRAALATDASTSLPMPDARVLQAIDDALAAFDGPFAVRSSALDEDGEGHSFAGQLVSLLHVERTRVPQAIVEVWRSGFGERVVAYRQSRGMQGPPSAPTVLVQRMVRADSAGVAFAADPTTGRLDCAMIAAVRGTADALVSGEVDGDTWIVERTDERIAMRSVAPIPSGLSDAQIRAIARLAHAVSAARGAPQDIEWAFEGERLFLLQARPITTLSTASPAPAPAAHTEAGASVKIWDNSNIAESYGGVTSPLTFSFARRAYEGVYREFCRLMGVSERRIEAADGVFRGMLGRIDGRVYYDLLNWYRLIALLPGYALNRGFMEQMMGVRKPLPDELQKLIAVEGESSRLLEWLRVGRLSFSLVSRLIGLPASVRRFRALLDDALRPPATPIAEMPLDRLAEHYRDLESRLLRRWDAPIVNDFFAMIFFGTLRKLVTKWCPGAPPALANELVCDLGDVISAEPVRRMRAMGQSIADRPPLIATLRDAPVAEAFAAARADPMLGPALERYLDEFGDRCLEELKLESPTLSDDPSTLLHSLAEIAMRREPVTTQRSEPAPPQARLRAALRGGPLRGLIARFVLRQAIARVRERENLRFERTRLFGRIRRIVVAMGERLASEGRLDRPEDVFLLEIEELLGWIEGTTTTADLAGLARLRGAEMRTQQAMPAPPERFITRGPTTSSPREPDETPATDRVVPTGEERYGLGCRPGVVRGRVRLVRDPRGARINRGEILVAERTDPGWVLLFPVASGVVVERGSLLSHTAIVARELGLPAIVSLPGLVDWLRDGDQIEMDGGSGRVTRLGRVEATAAGSEALR
jgi:rifampicin phosphotransferase